MKLRKAPAKAWNSRIEIRVSRVAVAGPGNLSARDLHTILNNGSEGASGTYFELLLEARSDGSLEVRVPKQRGNA